MASNGGFGMTYEEAINIIEDVTWQDNGRHYGKIVPAREIAISALDKQIPKKPQEIIVIDREIFACPRCNEFLHGYLQSYCADCGQALDWSDSK